MVNKNPIDDLIVFVDTETTGDGFDPMHGTLEFSLILTKLNRKTNILEYIGDFNRKIKPHPSWKYQNVYHYQSININKAFKYAADPTAEHEYTATSALKIWLGKYVNWRNPKQKIMIAGYKVNHDIRALQNMFERQGDSKFWAYFWSPRIEVSAEAAKVLFYSGDLAKLDNHKLGTMCSYFGIAVVKAKQHSAQYDAMLAWKLYEKAHSINIKNKR